MYSTTVYKHLMLIFFSGEVSLHEIEEISNEVNSTSKALGELYIVAIVQAGCQFPRYIPDVLKALQLLNISAKNIKRLYGLQFHPIITFIAEVVTKTFKLHSKTIEAKTIEELLEIIERDAKKYPKLKASIKDLETIKNEILQNYPR